MLPYDIYVPTIYQQPDFHSVVAPRDFGYAYPRQYPIQNVPLPGPGANVPMSNVGRRAPGVTPWPLLGAVQPVPLTGLPVGGIPAMAPVPARTHGYAAPGGGLQAVPRGGGVGAQAVAGPFTAPATGRASVQGGAAVVGGAVGGLLGGQGQAARRPRTGTAAAGRGAGGAGAGGGQQYGYATAPAGVDPAWYRAFQDEHEGRTPEEFYARTGEGLAEALADRDWSERFARESGRPPTEWEWENHWYDTRAYGRPTGGGGGGGGGGRREQRPPLYVPPRTSWRK